MAVTLLSSTRRNVVAFAVVLTLLLAAWLAPFGAGTRTVTAHFPHSIGIFEGSDVTIMGVSVGRVQKVTPNGKSVTVEMTYSSDHKLPADVKAAIITPTLVADRFVQLVPAYSTGPALPDGGDIPLERSIVPVEMDEIYRSLNEITETLGPNGVDQKGALGDVLKTTANALEGNGAIGNDAIANLAAAARTLGDKSPELFDTVESLASITDTLAEEAENVDRFLKDLGKVSTMLSGESDELRQALEAIARAVGVTESFVGDNRELLVEDLSRLSKTLTTISRQRESLKETLTVAPLGLDNLALSFDAVSEGAGIRLQLGPTVTDLPTILCALATNAGAPDAACTLIKALLPPELLAQIGQQVTGGGVPTRSLSTSAGGTPEAAASEPLTTESPVIGLPGVGEKALVDQIKDLLAVTP
ncbi:MAG TPA: MCE family protein [Aeromicrobium sp.]|nr:MCE family protein [Aeromicrobium sp.]HKY57362.1 MCE family protein [Aeromicrobium sp.]